MTGPGRPKIPAASRRSRRVEVYLTRRELDALDRARGEVSRSAFLAALLYEVAGLTHS